MTTQMPVPADDLDIGWDRANGGGQGSPAARPETQIPALNVQLLQRVMAYIDNRPDRHDQQFWAARASGLIDDTTNDSLVPIFDDNGEPACGTSYCFAGWTAVLTAPKDARLLFNDVSTGDYRINELTGRPNSTWLTDTFITGSGSNQTTHLIQDHARQQLGLTGPEANQLFHYSNTRAELRAMVADLVAAEHQRLAAEIAARQHAQT